MSQENTYATAGEYLWHEFVTKKQSSNNTQNTPISEQYELDKVTFIEGELQYANTLYPLDAARIILLSWTGKISEDIDETIEVLFKEWYVKNNLKEDEYTKELWTAIQHLDCKLGVQYRLNVDAITQLVPQKVHINTKFGRIKCESNLHKTEKKPLSKEAKCKIRALFSKDFINDINILYNHIGGLRSNYTIEQTILSWIGYIVVRTIAEHSPRSITFESKKYLLEHKSQAELEKSI